MTRQTIIKTINDLLPEQPQEKLEAVLDWLEQGDDDFEEQLRADVDSGRFDKLIADIVAEDEAGETIDFETSCD